MAETYLLWFIVVKIKKENQVLKLTPYLFVFQIILTTICETNNFPWFYKINFISRALPWFLFGYYVYSTKEKLIRSRDINWIVTSIIGCIIALIPNVFKTTVNFSCIGLILYSISLFVIAIKHPEKSICKSIEYIGDKLSLNIYIFHPLMANVICFVFKHIFVIDTEGVVFLWIKPLITLVATIIFAFILDKIYQKIITLSAKAVICHGMEREDEK